MAGRGAWLGRSVAAGGRYLRVAAPSSGDTGFGGGGSWEGEAGTGLPAMAGLPAGHRGPQ